MRWPCWSFSWESTSEWTAIWNQLHETKMSIYNRERIQFSAFISPMPSFMAVLFNLGKVTSLLGKSDGLSYVTPWVCLYFLEPSCINCISGIYLIHPICALIAVMLKKFTNDSKSSTWTSLLSRLPSDALQWWSCAQFSKQPQDGGIYLWIRYYKTDIRLC